MHICRYLYILCTDIDTCGSQNTPDIERPNNKKKINFHINESIRQKMDCLILF